MVYCPKCGAERVYMGSKLAIIEAARLPIRIRCGKCGASIKLN
jgi:ribosomal protein S27AE